MIAAQGGHLDAAQLFAHGAAVNQAMSDGRTPLWIAAQKGDLAFMRLILQKGADVNIRNDHHTPLHETASRMNRNSNRKAVAEILVQEAKAGIDPEDTEGDTPLSWAAEGGDLEMVQFFVENGANIDHVAHNDGATPLLWAAKNGHQGVVAYLVEQGANIETVNKNGATPLMIAAQEGRLDVVQYLVAREADVHAIDQEGNTALHQAAKAHQWPMVKLLLEEGGADVNRKDNLGTTILMLASANGQEEVVELILALNLSLNNGANINEQDIDGRTALIWANKNNHKTIAKLLQDNGADAIQARYEGMLP